MLVFYGNEPCLNVETLDVKTGPNVGKKFGLHRDRFPDRDWAEMRSTALSEVQEIEETPKLKQILLEDLAYIYGSNTNKFTEKLKEFKFI